MQNSSFSASGQRTRCPDTALAQLGIRLRDHRPGKHRTACPECAKAKHRRGDTTLAVRLDDTGATWLCFRCGTTGGLWPCADCGGFSPSRVCPACQQTRNEEAADARLTRRAVPPSSPTPSPAPPPRAGLSDDARRLWNACRPIGADSPAAVYLESRGCALPENDVRWHPQLRHPCGYVGPVLMALVTDVHSVEPISLHRTWLAPDGSGKAPIDRPRLLLKGHRKAGGVIRLVEDAEVTLGLAIAEGLETALTTMRAFRHCWCCIDAGNLAAFPVLAGIDALTIVEDRDPAGQAAARACADRWLAAAGEVWIWHAPAEGQDFNDIARRAAS
jgi:putative DNA primase/helicase